MNVSLIVQGNRDFSEPNEDFMESCCHVNVDSSSNIIGNPMTFEEAENLASELHTQDEYMLSFSKWK